MIETLALIISCALIGGVWVPIVALAYTVRSRA